MSILRMVGIAAVALSGVLLTQTLNGIAKVSLLQIESFILLIRFFKTEIECFASPIPRILSKCPRNIIIGCGYLYDEEPKDAEALLLGCKFSDSKTEECVKRFFSSLGRGYIDEQLVVCDYCISELEERRRRLSDTLTSRIKINSALCLGGALAVVILLI